MKPEDKDTTKGTSFLGIVISAALHAVVLILVLFWGFSGTSNNSGPSGPIEVSLSDLGPGGGGRGSNPANQPIAPPREPEKPKPAMEEPPPVENKEEVKEAPPEPEKKEEPKEPEKKEVKKAEVKKEEPKKEEKPKEVVKEPEKKEVIPLETEKKEVVKKEEPKKTEPLKEKKKEVAEKPKPTEKPKTEAKKTTPSKKKDFESEKNKVLQDIKRQRVLEELKSGTQENPQPEEEMGEEQRLAMGDSGNEPGESESGPGNSSQGSRSIEGGGGGSSINPVLLNLYKDKVHRKISRNWSMPPGVPTDGSLVAGVFFRVDQTGRVFDVRINSSSGNAAFDEYCVSAIRRSAPLPAPPSEFAKQAENDGIEVSFRNAPY